VEVLVDEVLPEEFLVVADLGIDVGFLACGKFLPYSHPPKLIGA